MSGICAIRRKASPARLAEALASLSGGLSLTPVERTGHATDLEAGMGVGVSARFDTQQIWRSPRILIACDADLYNEDELTDRLSDCGPFPENARTAALLAALYERFGCDFVEKLRGGFSVVLWDRRMRQMVAAVDRFGIKRLVYYQDRNSLLVSSRADAIARTGEIELTIDPRAIANVLNFGSNLGPGTVLAKVHRLMPGTMLLASDGQTLTKRYWDMRYGVGGGASEKELSRELESLVEESVAAHCKKQAFSSVGAFLSGGTDSSTVVGMMSRMQQGPVKAFSIGFEEQPFNELGFAAITAKKFQAEHYTYLVGPADCFDALPHMVRFFDEPFANSSAIPTYFCARLAAQHGVDALLAGDGGDELFGGNERYATDKIFEAYHGIPRPLRKALIEPVLAWLPVEPGLVRKARGYVRRANMPGIQRLLSFQFLFTHAPAEVFADDFLAELGEYSILDIPSRYYDEAPARDHLDRILYADMKITLGDSDLPKVTCMSELAGIQARFPFLDQRVAEFSGRLPVKLKVKGFEKRYLFKRAFRDLLPIEVIQKKKHGFGIPVAPWLKSDRQLREFSRDVLLSARTVNRGYFRREFIESLFRSSETDDSCFSGDMIWAFLAVELWHRQNVDEPARMAV